MIRKRTRLFLVLLALLSLAPVGWLIYVRIQEDVHIEQLASADREEVHRAAKWLVQQKCRRAVPAMLESINVDPQSPDYELLKPLDSLIKVDQMPLLMEHFKNDLLGAWVLGNLRRFAAAIAVRPALAASCNRQLTRFLHPDQDEHIRRVLSSQSAVFADAQIIDVCVRLGETCLDDLPRDSSQLTRSDFSGLGPTVLSRLRSRPTAPGIHRISRAPALFDRPYTAEIEQLKKDIDSLIGGATLSAKQKANIYNRAIVLSSFASRPEAIRREIVRLIEYSNLDRLPLLPALARVSMPLEDPQIIAWLLDDLDIEKPGTVIEVLGAVGRFGGNAQHLAAPLTKLATCRQDSVRVAATYAMLGADSNVVFWRDLLFDELEQESDLIRIHSIIDALTMLAPSDPEIRKRVEVALNQVQEGGEQIAGFWIRRDWYSRIESRWRETDSDFHFEMTDVVSLTKLASSSAYSLVWRILVDRLEASIENSDRAECLKALTASSLRTSVSIARRVFASASDGKALSDAELSDFGEGVIRHDAAGVYIAAAGLLSANEDGQRAAATLAIIGMEASRAGKFYDKILEVSPVRRENEFGELKWAFYDDQVESKPWSLLYLAAPEFPGMTASLLDCLRERRSPMNACLSLARMGEAAVPGLRELCRSADDLTKGWAAFCLSRMGEPAVAALPELRNLAKSPRKDLSRAAIDAIASLAPFSAEARSELESRAEDSFAQERLALALEQRSPAEEERRRLRFFIAAQRFPASIEQCLEQANAHSVVDVSYSLSTVGD